MNKTHSTAAEKVLDRAVDCGAVHGLMGLVGTKDDVLLHHACGNADFAGRRSWRSDSIVQIASMTKLVSTIAALQLVEQKKLNLNADICSYAPELASVKVLDGFDSLGNPILRMPCRAPNVRQLITHTSGYVYFFLNENASNYLSHVPYEGSRDWLIRSNLGFDPGSNWEYGTGIDILAILVEKVSDCELADFFSHNIFEPLSMIDTSFRYAEEKLDRSVEILHKKDGLFSLADEALQPYTPLPDGTYFTGGGGLYSSLLDYSHLIRSLMCGGILEGNRILQETTVASMFRNHIGNLHVNPSRSPMEYDFCNDFDPGFGSEAKWGLGFLLHTNGTENGRSPGSVSWCGLFNSYFWIDRGSNVFGIFATQLLPFFENDVVDHLVSFERAVYGIID